VFVEKDTKIVFEIAVTPAIDVGKVSSALESVDYFVVLPVDLMVLKGTERMLEEVQSDKVRIYLASHFLTALKKGTLDIITLNTFEQQNNKNNQNSHSSDVEQEENRSDS
jgi:hypothetical protein